MRDCVQGLLDNFITCVGPLSTHPFGCRVIQRMLEHCRDEGRKVRAWAWHVRARSPGHTVKPRTRNAHRALALPSKPSSFVCVGQLHWGSMGMGMRVRTRGHTHTSHAQAAVMEEILKDVCGLTRDQYGERAASMCFLMGLHLAQSA